LSRPFWNFFLLHPHENQSELLGYQGWVEILMIIMFLPMYSISLYGFGP
jgi:hypothetical protein